MCLSSLVASPQKGINDEIRRFIITSSKQHGKWLNGPEAGNFGDADGAMSNYRVAKWGSEFLFEWST